MAISSDGAAVVVPAPGSDDKGNPRTSDGAGIRTSPLNVGFPSGQSGSKVRRQPGRSAR